MSSTWDLFPWASASTEPTAGQTPPSSSASRVLRLPQRVWFVMAWHEIFSIPSALPDTQEHPLLCRNGSIRTQSRFRKEREETRSPI